MALGLAIETSCDETAVCLYDSEKGILKNLVSSQVKLHAPYGGVVPELSAREHVKSINILLEEVFKNTDLSYADLDFVAVTVAPGLILSLVVGVAAAKAIAHTYEKPLVPVHHLKIPDYEKYVKYRDSNEDILKKSTKDELKRTNLKDIIISNLKRSEESARVLEEVFKLIDINLSEEFKKARYLLYNYEKEILSLIDNEKLKMGT
jgi:hypothetical protein